MKKRNFPAGGEPAAPGGQAAEFEVDLPPLLPPEAVAPDLEQGPASGWPRGRAAREAIPPARSGAAGASRTWAGSPEQTGEVAGTGGAPLQAPRDAGSSAVVSHAKSATAGVESPVPVRKGLSGAGAFGMAVLAQAVLTGIAISVIWAFPKETGAFLRKVADRLDLAVAVPAPGFLRAVGGEAAVDRLAILELEDRALFRAERGALEQLQRLAREIDSNDARFDAVQASLIRVRQSYHLSQGEVPAPLDPREILPGIETERDLPVTAVVDLLRNRRQSVAKRQRAAYLLGAERHSAAAKNALFHAIQDDPSLVVVRQAFQSFQELTGYPGRDFFDADAVDRWWAQNSASFMSQHAEK